MSNRLLEFIHLSRFFIRKTESNEPSDDSTECDALLFGCDDLSFALPEKASISLSDLDLPNTFAVGGEGEYVGKEGGSSFLDSFTGLESTFTT